VISNRDHQVPEKRPVKDLEMSKVARKILTPSALAVGLAAGLLADLATAGDELVTYRAPVLADFKVDGQVFRSEIDSYIRALNEELRLTLDQNLRRDLAPKLEFASNELRARG
jgi:hypothetical protein